MVKTGTVSAENCQFVKDQKRQKADNEPFGTGLLRVSLNVTLGRAPNALVFRPDFAPKPPSLCAVSSLPCVSKTCLQIFHATGKTVFCIFSGTLETRAMSSAKGGSVRGVRSGAASAVQRKAGAKDAGRRCASPCVFDVVIAYDLIKSATPSARTLTARGESGTGTDGAAELLSMHAPVLRGSGWAKEKTHGHSFALLHPVHRHRKPSKDCSENTTRAGLLHGCGQPREVWRFPLATVQPPVLAVATQVHYLCGAKPGPCVKVSIRYRKEMSFYLNVGPMPAILERSPK